MEMACLHCDVFSDLNYWPFEKLDNVIEIECPNCGALHHMYQGLGGNLNVYLTEDNG